MNTLSKETTGAFFKSPEDYTKLRKFWAVKIQNREKLPAHIHLTYKALIGKDWRKGFVTGSEGRYIAYTTAIASLRWTARNRACAGGAFKLLNEFLSDEAAELLLGLINTDDTEVSAYKQKAQV